MSEYKITQKDIELFEELTRFFVKALGLKSWEVGFDIDEEDQLNRAYTKTMHDSKIVVFYLVRCWDYKPKKEELELMAFHEVCELFMCEIMDKLLAFYSEQETERMIHSVIRTLENVFMPYLIEEYKKGKKNKRNSNTVKKENIKRTRTTKKKK